MPVRICCVCVTRERVKMREGGVCDRVSSTTRTRYANIYAYDENVVCVCEWSGGRVKLVKQSNMQSRKLCWNIIHTRRMRRAVRHRQKCANALWCTHARAHKSMHKSMHTHTHSHASSIGINEQLSDNCSFLSEFLSLPLQLYPSLFLSLYFCIEFLVVCLDN